MAIGEEPRRRLVRRAAAGDHVARHRPRRAAEADQRRFLRQVSLEAVQSFEDWLKPAPVGLVSQLRQALRVADRIEAGPIAGFKGDGLTQARRG